MFFFFFWLCEGKMSLFFFFKQLCLVILNIKRRLSCDCCLETYFSRYTKSKGKYFLTFCPNKTNDNLLFIIHIFVFIMLSILFNFYIVGGSDDKNQESANYLECSWSILDLRMSWDGGKLDSCQKRFLVFYVM